MLPWCCHLNRFGVELNQLTGIAAILTFPLDVEVVEMEEREAKEELERINQEQGESEDERTSA